MGIKVVQSLNKPFNRVTSWSVGNEPMALLTNGVRNRCRWAFSAITCVCQPMAKVLNTIRLITQPIYSKSNFDHMFCLSWHLAGLN